MNQRLNTSQKENGVVLVIVLIVVAILTTLVVDLIYFTQIDMEISANTRDEIKARYIAKAGVHVLAGTMRNRALEELTDIAALAGGENETTEGFWSINVPYFPIGEGSVSITVVDERSKLNLNSLVSQRSNQVDRQVQVELKELFRLLEVKSDKSSLFIASLINWLDRPLEGSQNNQSPDGADGSYYQGLEAPYRIKDGPLDSVKEILLIRGMDEEFFGKIKDYVTVYPEDKNVNFSTASTIVMRAALMGANVSSNERQETESDGISEGDAERIVEDVIEARQEDPVVDLKRVRDILEEVNPTSGVSAGLSGVVFNSGTSEIFSVKSVGILGETNPTTRVIESVLKKEGSGGSRGVDIVSWKEQ